MRLVYHSTCGYAYLPGPYYDIYDFYLSHNNNIIINYTYVHRKSWNTGIIPVVEHFIARCWMASWIIIDVDLLAAAQWWLQRVIADFCKLHYCYCIIARISMTTGKNTVFATRTISIQIRIYCKFFVIRITSTSCEYLATVTRRHFPCEADTS